MSTRIAVTTIVRSAGLEVPAGWLRVLSADGWHQDAMAPLPDALHRARDPNPRGGCRGGRGLAATPDRLAVAINDRILLLDRDWRVTRTLSHRWLGGIHDIAADGDGIWAACADNDLVVRLDWEGRLLGHWHWRRGRRLRRALGFGWLPSFDRGVDHRDPLGGGFRVDLSHLNALALDGDALLVGLGFVHTPVPLIWPVLRERGSRCATRVGLGRPAEAVVALWRRSPAARIGARRLGPDLARVTPGKLPVDRGVPADSGSTWAVVELRPRTARRPHSRLVAREPAGGVPSHNVLPVGDLLVVNDSAGARVVALDRATGTVVESVELPGELPFPRGLMRLDDGRFVVGTQDPAALTVVDLPAGRVDERIELPDDRGESPYAIAAVPAAFGDPGLLPTTRAGWGIAGADASPAAAAEELAAATS